MDDNQKQDALKKKLTITLAVSLAAIAMAVATIITLKTAVPQTDSGSVQNTTPLKAHEVTAAYMTEGVIKALSETVYSHQMNMEAQSRVVYKADGHAYAASIPAKENLLYYAKNKLEKDDINEVQAQTTAFMTARGLSLVDQKVSNADTPKYTTYKNAATVCQLTDVDNTNDPASPSYHELACTDSDTIQDEYAVIEKLLGLYKTSHQLADFTQATRVLVSEGNKSMAILTFVGIQSHPALLFAAVDGTWAYIGDIGSGTTSNGKYSLTPEVKAAIADPKYEGFLKKNIGN